jgi:hypothetical protein
LIAGADRWASLSFRVTQGGGFYDEATALCNGKPARLVIVVWPDPTRPDDKSIVTDQLAGLPLSIDGMALTIALTDDPASVPMPPHVADDHLDDGGPIETTVDDPTGH